jgi:hypothetical protein
MGLDDPNYHWFLGAGMVHGVRLRDGRAEWYRNRWFRFPPRPDPLGFHGNWIAEQQNPHECGAAGRAALSAVGEQGGDDRRGHCRGDECDLACHQGNIFLTARMHEP